MEFEIKINNKPITVKLEKRNGMKHCYLRILNSEVLQIRANRYFTIDDAKKLIEKKLNWIEKNIERLSLNKLKKDEFYYLGIKHKNLDDRNLDIFYKNEAKRLIPPIVEKYSNEMNLFPILIKYRKNKRTWGSCNYKNEINFNILLVKFPLEVIEYIVIHELAHIKHKNHSKNFWDFVKIYCEDYKRREELLKSFL